MALKEKQGNTYVQSQSFILTYVDTHTQVPRYTNVYQQVSNAFRHTQIYLLLPTFVTFITCPLPRQMNNTHINAHKICTPVFFMTEQIQTQIHLLRTIGIDDKPHIEQPKYKQKTSYMPTFAQKIRYTYQYQQMHIESQLHIGSFTQNYILHTTQVGRSVTYS